MPTTTSKPQAPKGFTMVPNWLIDDKRLTAAEKWSIISVARRAYGAKTSAWPSQTKIANTGGFDRKTIRKALQAVTACGMLEPIRCHERGVVEYRLHIDEPPASFPRPEAYAPGDLGNRTQVTGGVIPTKHSKVKDQEKNTLVPPDNTSNGEVAVIRGDLHGNEYGNCSAYNPPEAYAPGRSEPRFTKREINELLLTPDGKRPDVEGLESDLFAVLAMVHAPKHFDTRQLEKLVAEHGAEYCTFWVSWLLRKIAAEYDAGRPVENPAGLFAKAVRDRWEVDPKWPEFDETRHAGVNDRAWLTELEAEMPF